MQSGILERVENDVRELKQRNIKRFFLTSKINSIAYLIGVNRTLYLLRYRWHDSYNQTSRTSLSRHLNPKRRKAFIQKVLRLLDNTRGKLISGEVGYKRLADGTVYLSQEFSLNLEELLRKYNVLTSMERKEKELLDELNEKTKI